MAPYHQIHPHSTPTPTPTPTLTPSFARTHPKTTSTTHLHHLPQTLQPRPAHCSSQLPAQVAAAAPGKVRHAQQAARGSFRGAVQAHSLLPSSWCAAACPPPPACMVLRGGVCVQLCLYARTHSGLPELAVLRLWQPGLHCQRAHRIQHTLMHIAHTHTHTYIHAPRHAHCARYTRTCEAHTHIHSRPKTRPSCNTHTTHTFKKTHIHSRPKHAH